MKEIFCVVLSYISCMLTEPEQLSLRIEDFIGKYLSEI